jgi:hypothetical protein
MYKYYNKKTGQEITAVQAGDLRDNEKIVEVIMEKKVIKTKDEARQYAIDLQKWASKKSLSYGEICRQQDELEKIAKEFDLIEEFKENGII